MILMKTLDPKTEQVHPRAFTLEITREQEHAVMEEARRWEMEEVEILQFILRWGFEMFFRR